ncbi:MAG: phosphotransferase [Gammaproteobacteria bacterium]|nr:phosphotransferase [Gammaproteobacteria bacterium]
MINTKIDNDNLVISVFDKIDTTNFSEVEKEIKLELDKEKIDSLVLDFEELKYISSAGLRMLLHLKQLTKSFKVINANLEVYNILEMTGFTKILDVTKALRRVSIDGCKVIGEGANGKVYRIKDDIIVKVYKKPDMAEIQNEIDVAKRAFILGVPTAISYDIVKVDDTYGTVFELLDAKSLQELIIEDPSKIDEYVLMSVKLLKSIHAIQIEDGSFKRIKDKFINFAELIKEYLDKETGDKLVRLIKGIKDTNNLLHGDFHIKNIMMSNDEPLLIDMDTMCVGNPIFELSFIFNAYLGFGTLDERAITDFLGISFKDSETLFKDTIVDYYDLNEENYIEVKNKIMVLGYTKILHRTIFKKKALEREDGIKEVEVYKTKIKDLLESIDDLNIN